MKTKYWVMILAGILIVCILACIPLFSTREACTARILSDGEVVRQVDLRVDQQFEIPASNGGSNTVTVQDGKIAVTAASCPDRYCMHRGFCNSGSSIVCLPNKLVIEFLAEETVDGAVG